MDELRDAVQYFQGERGFDRLFSLIKKKYKGNREKKLTGHVVVKNISPHERKCIEGIIGDTQGAVNVKVNLVKFEKELQETRFSNVQLIDLLFAYFEQEILTNVEEKEKFRNKRASYWSEVFDKSELGDWLHMHISEGGEGTSYLHARYMKEPNELQRQIKNAMEAIAFLKGPTSRIIYLPMLATEIAKDPHYFDIQNDSGKVLISLLQLILFKEEGRKIDSTMSAEYLTEMLAQFGILRDDIANNVTIFGLRANYGDGKDVGVFRASFQERMSFNLPLRELRKVASVYSDVKKVFVIENSGLYSELLNQLDMYDRTASLICTHGQIRVAAITLLDLLVKSGNRIYYAGDYDVGGLLIAQRLINRYGDRLNLWRYSIEDYKRSLSNNEIPTSLLRKLDNITHPELVTVANKIKDIKKAGYQEHMVGSLIIDILDDFKLEQIDNQ